MKEKKQGGVLTVSHDEIEEMQVYREDVEQYIEDLREEKEKLLTKVKAIQEKVTMRVGYIESVIEKLMLAAMKLPQRQPDLPLNE